ncbi:MAG: phosphate acyltransferase PlsX [Planctomycetota bacterium]|nr:phosphate acyltransferase PlsX [Planctomycetota bacterium]
MRIGVDVMGGDNAPDAILEGAIASLDQIGLDDELVLVGDPQVINPAVSQLSAGNDRVTVVACTDVIGMDEPPVEAVRSKKNSSLVVLARMAGRRAEHTLDAMISAGNTGACVTAAQMYLRRLPNVHRPGVAVTVPTFCGPVVLIDVGANLEPKPHHLAQYGVMGEVYARLVLGIDRPRVALMNVGGEDQKGTAEMKQARDTLRANNSLQFVGYIEGRAVFNGEADVVVTDGVVGNVMIKLAEGLSAGIFKAIAREVLKIDPELAARFEPVVKSIYAKHDYHEYGGAPLLGVNGVCLICHGSSVARTITNAVSRAKQFVESGVNQAISQQLGIMEEVIA